MLNKKILKKLKETDYPRWRRVYGRVVAKKVKRRYSLDEEIALERQKDKKPEEHAAYDAYVEECKVEARAEMGETE